MLIIVYKWCLPFLLHGICFIKYINLLLDYSFLNTILNKPSLIYFYGDCNIFIKCIMFPITIEILEPGDMSRKSPNMIFTKALITRWRPWKNRSSLFLCLLKENKTESYARMSPRTRFDNMPISQYIKLVYDLKWRMLDTLLIK